MTKRTHEYALRAKWLGEGTEGTTTYAGYTRAIEVRVGGKAPLAVSADAAFRGDPAKHNPEDLLLAALASCHMLAYLALCARKRITVLAYEDDARATLVVHPDGGGEFESVTLRPHVVLAAGADREAALALHHDASSLCFIARSVRTAVHHEPTIVVATAPG
jgi:organic hydroperoxide reductase OsmC/OhrA